MKNLKISNYILHMHIYRLAHFVVASAECLTVAKKVLLCEIMRNFIKGILLIL